MQINYDEFTGIITFDKFKWSDDALDSMLQLFKFSQLIRLMSDHKEIYAVRYGIKYTLTIKDDMAVCTQEKI
jgi:hypothetical protein